MSESWRVGVTRGLVGAALALGLGAIATRGGDSPLLVGAVAGLAGAFVAAYLRSATRANLIPCSWAAKAISVLLLPPVGSGIAFAFGRAPAVGFTFVGLATWLLLHGLWSLEQRPLQDE